MIYPIFQTEKKLKILININLFSEWGRLPCWKDAAISDLFYPALVEALSRWTYIDYLLFGFLYFCVVLVFPFYRQTLHLRYSLHFAPLPASRGLN